MDNREDSLIEETSLVVEECADDTRSLLDGETQQDDYFKNDVDLEAKRKYLMDPEHQADIILTNYINSIGYTVNRQEKRRMRNEFLKNARKGKYNKMFLEQIGVFDEKAKEKAGSDFAKLNG